MLRKRRKRKREKRGKEKKKERTKISEGEFVIVANNGQLLPQDQTKLNQAKPDPKILDSAKIKRQVRIGRKYRGRGQSYGYSTVFLFYS
jgi:hypothetical protein